MNNAFNKTKLRLLAFPFFLLLVFASSEDENRKKEPLEVPLPKPPTVASTDIENSQQCVECHEEIAKLIEGDKHIAKSFGCVTCHGVSIAHLNKDEETSPPDHYWRRWLEEEGKYEWRVENASLELSKLCASCHDEKAAESIKTAYPGMKTISWNAFINNKHGKAVYEGNHDAPACTDCHLPHGAGAVPWTNESIVDQCGVCHGDKEMMKRNKVDAGVMKDFEKGTHEDMDKAPPEEKASCVKCHSPHGKDPRESKAERD